MYLIVGLGNPGLKYAATRHNIGFEAIERIAYEHHIDVTRKKFKAFVGEGRIGTDKVLLMKPQTYMNLSGESVKAAVDFYKIPLENIIVIFDDCSLEVGQLRIRVKGSAGGHNGIKNIIAHLGTNEFGRIKVGVGEKPAGWDLADYVLGRFSDKEIKEVMVPTLKEVNDAVEKIIREDFKSAMNVFNCKKKV